MSGLLWVVFTLLVWSSIPQDIRSALSWYYFICQEHYPTRCQVCSLSFILYLSGALSNKMSSLLSFVILYLSGALSNKMSGLLWVVFTLLVWSSIPQDIRSALSWYYFICQELYPTRCQVCSLRLYFICLELYPTRCQVCSLSFILYLSGALSNKMSGLLWVVFTLLVWSSIQQDVKSALFRLYFICLELYPTRCQVCSLSFILYLSGALSNKMSSLLSFVYTLFVWSSIQQDVRSALSWSSNKMSGLLVFRLYFRSALPRFYFIWQELYPTRCQVCSASSLLYLTGALSHKELIPTRCQVCSLSFILYLSGALSNKMSGLLWVVFTLLVWSSIQQDVRSALSRFYFISLELYPTRYQVCSVLILLYLSGALSNKMSFYRSSFPQDVKSALFRLYFICLELYPTRCQVCSLSLYFICLELYLRSNKMSGLLWVVFTLLVWSSIPQDIRSALSWYYFICQELYPTRCQVSQVCSLAFILYLSGALSNKMSSLLSFVYTLFVWSSMSGLPTRCQVCSESFLLY